MLHDQYKGGFRAARRIGSVLVCASVGAASAIGGAAVALQLAPGQQTGEHFTRPGAATAAVIAAAPMEKRSLVAAVLPSPGQAASAAGPSTVSASSVTEPAPSRALAPLDERELTFAWGYAQRHPGASARQAEPGAGRTVAGARTRGVATTANSERRHTPERRSASAAPQNTVGFASSRFVAGFAVDSHQESGSTEPRYANGLRMFDRAQSAPGPRHRSPSAPPRA